MRSSTTDHTGRIAVVGAGIAGLTFAAWLGRFGLRATLYEQAGALGDVGAGIQLGPNSVRLLRRLGLTDDLRAVAVRPEVFQMRGWRDGELIGRTGLGRACETRFGAPYYTLHRADLHRCLVSAVQRAGATVDLGRRCVAATEGPAGVELSFADGGTAVADLVVGADGIRSAIHRALAADEPRFTGTTVYRGLISADRCPTRLVGPRVALWLGPGQHCVWYPVCAGRSYSVAAVVRGEAGYGRGEARPAGSPSESARAESARAESWRAPGDVAQLAAAFAGWHPDVKAMLAAAESVTAWALHDRVPLANWHSDRMVLIGDAAHAMLPFGAHGANQAIESAVTLATCLAGAAGGPGDALSRYQELRQERVARVVAAVARNARDHHLCDGPGQRRRNRSLHAGLGLSGQDWLYGHDAEAAAMQVWPTTAGPRSR